MFYFGVVQLRPKEDWKPYLTPDRELVKYEDGLYTQLELGTSKKE